MPGLENEKRILQGYDAGGQAGVVRYTILSRQA